MSSLFTPVLGTNYCPMNEEVKEIEALLIKPSLRLKHLDDKIAALQKLISEFTQEHDEIRIYVDAHRALISPVRHLPLDIIEEIFVTCLPTHPNCIMSTQEAPVLLGRICSVSRMISLSTPHLWASLHVVGPIHPFEVNVHIYKEKIVQRLEAAVKC
ncbi:hypothetical protein B0H10DRAFT_2208787 [Mycena sp. CBHHK59/15]|nr:hypothetical protein B0H10DRAFT_2208787 [Mycena sp. CBHHK59/15]